MDQTKQLEVVAPPAPTRPTARVNLSLDAMVPHRPVEVVTPEEERLEEQARPKAVPPTDFFRRSPIIDPPLAPGITVNTESLLGFLTAIEMILPPETNYPILSSAKLSSLANAATPTLYLEAGSHAVWTMVGLKGEAAAPRGFEAMIPVRRARNVLRGLRDDYPRLTVGVDEQGVCMGPRTVPFGGHIDDFPSQPIVTGWEARAAMPATYYREICDRVLVVRSDVFGEKAMHGVLLDFEFDGEGKPACTVVVTDGKRIHLLRLPQMMIECKPTHLRALPPTCTVSAGFFAYLKEIVQHEWSVLEFAGAQLVARGEDFIVVAHSPAEIRTDDHPLLNWRRVAKPWTGGWLVERAKLEPVLDAALLTGAATTTCQIVIDGARQAMTIRATSEQGDEYTSTIACRRAGTDAPMRVDVLIDLGFLLDAVTATRGGLIRLTFGRDQRLQSLAPIVVRGEDDQFQAIIMPIIEGAP